MELLVHRLDTTLKRLAIHLSTSIYLLFYSRVNEREYNALQLCIHSIIEGGGLVHSIVGGDGFVVFG